MGNNKYMKKVILSVDGMRCSACSASLEKYLNNPLKKQNTEIGSH